MEIFHARYHLFSTLKFFIPAALPEKMQFHLEHEGKIA